MKKLIYVSLWMGSIALTDGYADDLLQRQLSQQQIRAVTQTISEQLTQLIDESTRNRITGEDATVLRAVQSILTRLSEAQMRRVITLLQQAREHAADATQRQYILDAYGLQKEIVQQLHQLLSEHQRQQALLELSSRFGELASRQTTNLREATALAEWKRRNPTASFTDAQRTSLVLQNTEQQSIKNEVATLVDRLDSLANNSSDLGSERAAHAKKTSDENRLLDALETASNELTQADPETAATQETRARDTLLQLSRQLDVSQSQHHTDFLAQAKVLQQAITVLQHQQTDLQRESEINPAASQAQIPKQAHLRQQAEALRKQAGIINPIAAEHLDQAVRQMKNAQEELTTKTTPPSVSKFQSIAASELTKAVMELGRLTGLLEDAQKSLAAIEAAGKQLEHLAATQQQLNLHSSQPHAPTGSLSKAQSTLGEQTDKLRQNVTPHAPFAGQELRSAQQHMQTASADLSASEQNAALNDLYQAQEALQQRANEFRVQLGQSIPTDPKAIGRLSEQLRQAQAELDKARKEISSASFDKVADTTGQLAATSSPSFPQSARQALQQARNFATAASQAAAQRDAGKAQEHAQAAQESLSRALVSMRIIGQGSTGDLTPPDTSTTTSTNLLTGSYQFLGLPPRDREAIRQSQAEKYPAEYASQIEQYLRNLAEARKP